MKDAKFQHSKQRPLKGNNLKAGWEMGSTRPGFKGLQVCESAGLQVCSLRLSHTDRIQIDVGSQFTRQMKPYRFENAPLLSVFSNRPGFGNGLDRRRVNGRCNCIENDAVTNETAFV